MIDNAAGDADREHRSLMAFTHTGGWLGGRCDDPSIWQGTVNGDCFLKIQSADFPLTGGTVTPPVLSSTMTPSGGSTNAGPWFISLNGAGHATYQFAFPGIRVARDLTVRAIPYLPPTVVGSTVINLNQSGTSFGTPTLSGSIGTIQLLHFNARNSPATHVSSLPGWTFLGRQDVAFSGQTSTDEWWWRLSSATSSTGHTTGPNWTLGIYNISNVQSPWQASPIRFAVNALATATLTTTATDIGAWLTYDREFFAAETIVRLHMNPVAVFPGATSITVTKSSASEGTVSGLVLPAATITPVDLTGSLDPCPAAQGWVIGVDMGPAVGFTGGR